MVKITINVSMSNYIPNESSWRERTEKIGYYDIWQYQVSKITFCFIYQRPFLSILPLFLAKNSYKHKCNDYQNNFNKNFY